MSDSAVEDVDLDHYAVLGIERHSSLQDVRKAYRALALSFHPDKNPNGEAMFKSITRAYQVLGDDHRKDAYDKTLPAKYKAPAARPSSATTPPTSRGQAGKGYSGGGTRAPMFSYCASPDVNEIIARDRAAEAVLKSFNAARWREYNGDRQHAFDSLGQRLDELRARDAERFCSQPAGHPVQGPSPRAFTGRPMSAPSRPKSYAVPPERGGDPPLRKEEASSLPTPVPPPPPPTSLPHPPGRGGRDMPRFPSATPESQSTPTTTTHNKEEKEVTQPKPTAPGSLQEPHISPTCTPQNEEPKAAAKPPPSAAPPPQYPGRMTYEQPKATPADASVHSPGGACLRPSQEPKVVSPSNSTGTTAAQGPPSRPPSVPPLAPKKTSSLDSAPPQTPPRTLPSDDTIQSMGVDALRELEKNLDCKLRLVRQVLLLRALGLGKDNAPVKL